MRILILVQKLFLNIVKIHQVEPLRWRYGGLSFKKTGYMTLFILELKFFVVYIMEHGLVDAFNEFQY